MHLDRLRIFHAAARLLSFTHAAEELHLTQPGVSKHVKELEAYYGTRLFQRIGRRIMLTDAGQILFEVTTDIFSRLNEAKVRIEELTGLASGVLKIGASVTIATYLLPGMLVEFRQNHPALEIQTEIGRSRRIVEKALDGSVEFGLVGHYSYDPRMIAKPFLTDRTALIISPSHRWAKRTFAVSPEELADEPFLISKRGSGTWRIVGRFLESTGVELKHILELGTTEGVKQAVEAGLGVSIVSMHVVAKELASGRIESIPLANGAPSRDLYLVRHKDRYLSNAARAFLSLCMPHAIDGIYPEDQTRGIPAPAAIQERND